jgi:hypothetical protein
MLSRTEQGLPGPSGLVGSFHGYPYSFKRLHAGYGSAAAVSNVPMGRPLVRALARLTAACEKNKP